MGLTALDIIVLLGVAATAVMGAVRGFVTEVLSLMTWLVVIFALKLLHVPLTQALAGIVGTSSGAAVLAFAVIAGVAWFGGRMLAKSIGSRTKQSILGPLDRAMGLGFGMLKGLIFASLGFLLVVLVTDTAWGGPKQRPGWLRHARTYPLLNATSTYIGEVVARRRRGAAMFGDDNGSAPATDTH